MKQTSIQGLRVQVGANNFEINKTKFNL
jgi:hypothetical protein